MGWRGEDEGASLARIRDAIDTLEKIREDTEGRDRDGITWVIGFLSGVVLPNAERRQIEGRKRRYYGFLTDSGQLCVRVWSREGYNSETEGEYVRKMIPPFYAAADDGMTDAMRQACRILRERYGIEIDHEEAIRRNREGR